MSLKDEQPVSALEAPAQRISEPCREWLVVSKGTWVILYSQGFPGRQLASPGLLSEPEKARHTLVRSLSPWMAEAWHAWVSFPGAPSQLCPESKEGCLRVPKDFTA